MQVCLYTLCRSGSRLHIYCTCI